MPWYFESKDGRHHGVFESAGEARRIRADDRVHSDGEFFEATKGAKLVYFACHGTSTQRSAQVIDDIGEHYNVGLDARIRGRRHFKEVMRQQGASEYEPSTATRERMKEVNARRIANYGR